MTGLELGSLLSMRSRLAGDVGFAFAEARCPCLERACRFGPLIQVGPGFLEPLALPLKLAAPALELAGLLFRLRRAPIKPDLGHAMVVAAEEPRGVLTGYLGDPGQDRGWVGDAGLVAIDGAERYAEALCECALGQPGFAPCARDPTAELKVVIGTGDRRLPRKTRFS